MGLATQLQESPINPLAKIVIIGAGPAGLMAAEVLSAHGFAPVVYDAMPSAGRKFLLAGRGGMNITHSEEFAHFVTRYAAAQDRVGAWLQDFGAPQLRAWVHGLGLQTFVGSSGRVFPTDMKAAPLLRAWLARLRVQGVQLHTRSRWLGWQDGGIVLESQHDGELKREVIACDALILALGGASWPRLGSDGAWVPLLAERGVAISPLRSSNCGFDIAWSSYFQQRFAGGVLPTTAISYQAEGQLQRKIGPCVLTANGIEGTLVYALSSVLREQIAQQGYADIYLDLMPDWDIARVQRELGRARGSRSWTSHLQSRLGLKGAQIGLLREVLAIQAWDDVTQLANCIKAVALRLTATRPLAEVISTAGGVALEALDEHLMLKQLPGVFCAGEMLDWEAPTGGYLLTACFASGHRAGHGLLDWLARQTR